MSLVDLNYNFECGCRLIELSDNKLSNNKLFDNNLRSELVRNRSFFKPITIEEIVTFMINNGTKFVLDEILIPASTPLLRKASPTSRIFQTKSLEFHLWLFVS